MIFQKIINLYGTAFLLFINIFDNEIIMKEKCQNCGKLLEDSLLTHCSNKCLFVGILNSKSVSRTPVEDWGDSDIV